MTEEQNKKVEYATEQMTNVMGWLITLDLIFNWIGSVFEPVVGNLVGLILCFADREHLRRNLNINIHWLRCFLTPTYLYKRCKLLGEPMTKFYINLAMYIWLVVFILVAGFAASSGVIIM